MLAIEDVADDETLTAIEQALERFGGTGTRVYAAIRAAQESTEQARGTAVRLHKACERHDQLWCGGVAICAGSGIAALRRSPRMGLLRRPFSEAMDKLVGAVRMGCSVEHAQKLGGAATGGVDTDGMVRATSALPTDLARRYEASCRALKLLNRKSLPINGFTPALDKAFQTPRRIGGTCRRQNDGGQRGAFL